MNTLAISTRHVAFAGKSKVYFRILPININQSSAASSDGDLDQLPDLKFSEEWTAKNAHIECIAFSKDEKLIAVADSAHGLQIFEIQPSSGSRGVWHPLFNSNSYKRLIKLQFTSDGSYLTLLDKQGDIFALRISSDHQNVSKIRKLMGHTSFISNYVACSKLNQIISCDRDEKIRISNFPDGYVIQGFKLGHTESVISVALIETSTKDKQDNVQENRYLLSISVTGVLILWDFLKPISGTETSFLKKRNVKNILSEEVKEAEIQSMKVCLMEGNILVAVTFTGFKKVCIFKISIPSHDIQLVQEVEADSDMLIIEWNEGHGHSITPLLIVYMPQVPSVKWWKPESTILSENDICNFSEEMRDDMKALGEVHKPSSSVPMRKRQTNFEDNLHVYPDQQKSS
ncbi:unnamed protein product [Orchesella dallaii]|uniref:WD repeat-containing protein 75 n=1 Tax=Orchesella dallaii TaxID=48710 RepID=A0ABP1Q8Q2_9HEXA